MKKIYSTFMMLATTLAAMTTLTSCEEEDDYIAKQLRDSDWQGYIDTYYSSRWSLSGNTYETVMHFESRGSYYTSGRGCEVDYDTRSPYNDYACCTFSWCIVEGNVILVYDDSKWNTTWIRNYRLSSTNFYGYIDDGSGRNIRFDLQSTQEWNNWSRYSTNGGYGGFSQQNWYRSRMRFDDSTDAVAEQQLTTAEVPFIDRTEQARMDSGESEAFSVASGVFAKAMGAE